MVALCGWLIAFNKSGTNGLSHPDQTVPASKEPRTEQTIESNLSFVALLKQMDMEADLPDSAITPSIVLEHRYHGLPFSGHNCSVTIIRFPPC
jgi:hypothetical protein